jgi:NAD(P)-dependent dehydrogenase (short-subunit alcohol dehydrogenase family)
MDLKGKTALVTGGARIGQEVALALAGRGCHVALIYRSSAKPAEAAARKIRALGRKALTLQADLSRPDDADRAVREVLRQWGGLDVLAHLASVYSKASISEQEKEPRGLDSGPGAVDLGAAYRLALRCAPSMRKRGNGRIILFSDWLPASGRPRYKDFLHYYVAKGGAKALTEALALELAPEILVNAVAPGPILPPDDMDRRAVAEVVKATPAARWGGAGEIAKAVLFFIESDFVTGETVRVDGGRHLL